MRIRTAGGCQWRGIYISFERRPKQFVQFFAIILDPDNGINPKLILLLPVGSFTNCNGEWPDEQRFEIPLPRIAFKYPCSRIRSLAYQFISRFWHNVDGRYGWFSANKNAKPIQMFGGYR
jgi:hypothetical protein